MRKYFRFHVTRNLEGSASGAGGAASGGSDGGAGAASGAGGASGGGAAADLAAHAAAVAGNGNQQQQQQQSQSQNPPQSSGAAYYPESLPQQFRGQTDKETIDKLAADVSARPAPPAEAKDYQLELSEEFVKRHGDLKDDPVVPIYQKIAHKYGLDQRAFNGILQDFYAGLEEAGVIEPPIDFDKELEKLTAGMQGDRRDKTIKAASRVNAIANFIGGLQTKGEITAQQATILSTMWASADAVAAFEKVLSLIPKEHGLQGGGAPAQQATDHEKAMRALYPTMIKS